MKHRNVTTSQRRNPPRRVCLSCSAGFDRTRRGAAGVVVLIIIGAIVGGAMIYRTADRMYLSPRAEMIAELESVTKTVEQYQAALDGRRQIHERIQRYVDRTLGGDIETVDHRLRTRLNRIAEQVELDSITVSTGTPRALGSPARGQFRGAALRELRDELDFIEVPGSVTAEGTLAQAIELIDRIDAEPWLKQMEDVTIDPRDNGRRFLVRVRLRTQFLPGHVAGTNPQANYDRGRLGRAATLVASNPFLVPPQPEPEPTRVAERPSPSFPLEQWVLTGVAEGSRGVEAWLRNRRSGESRRIEAGETIGHLVLIAAQGEFAEFERNDERFLVAVGASLNDRTPLNQ